MRCALHYLLNHIYDSNNISVNKHDVNNRSNNNSSSDSNGDRDSNSNSNISSDSDSNSNSSNNNNNHDADDDSNDINDTTTTNDDSNNINDTTTTNDDSNNINDTCELDLEFVVWPYNSLSCWFPQGTLLKSHGSLEHLPEHGTMASVDGHYLFTYTSSLPTLFQDKWRWIVIISRPTSAYLDEAWAVQQRAARRNQAACEGMVLQ
eukprot:s7569_g1.t1